MKFLVGLLFFFLNTCVSYMDKLPSDKRSCLLTVRTLKMLKIDNYILELG